MRNASEQDTSVQTAPTGAVSLSAPAPAKRRPAKLARGKLPRGIAEVRWENATTVDTVRYRVRINRKGFKADKLFDSLHDAQEFLLMSKTNDGRLGLTEREARDKVAAQVLKAMFARQPFSHYTRRYIKEYIERGPEAQPDEGVGAVKGNPKAKKEESETKKLSKKTNAQRVRGLTNVFLTWKPAAEKDHTGLLSTLPTRGSQAKRQRLGDFYLDEIDIGVANEFLKQRSKTHAPSTVSRERGQLQTIWNKLLHMEPGLAKSLPPGNPWQVADRSLIPASDAPRRQRHLSDDEEERLMKSLATCRNRQVPCVVGIALATGMRRSEVLMLEWQQIEDGFVTLRSSQTKNGQERFVSLNEEAQAIIKDWRGARQSEGIKPDQRLFPMTINAFKKSWERARVRADLKDFRFHDTRRVAITRMLREMAFPSATMLSSMTGMQSTAHIEREFVEPFQNRERARTGRVASEADIRADKGHADSRMTKRYANLGPQSEKKRDK